MPIGAFRLNTVSKLTAEATVIYARTAKTVTAVGNAQVSTAQSKFGGSSALFDGTGDYLQVSNDSSFTFGTSDFTIEFWLRLTSNTGTRIIWDQRPSGSQGLQPTIYQTGGTLYYYTNAGNRITSTSTLADSTWYHIAVSRSGTSTRMFINGAQTGSTYTDSNNYVTSSAGAFIGADQFSTGSNSVSGHIDEIRVSNSARYTSSFTPPSQAFVNDNNTLLLIHANGANASTTFTDDNLSHRRAVSVVGDAQVSTAQSKFGGASMLFDGTDYVTTEPTGFLFQSGESVTMECWVRLGATGSEYYGIMALGSSRGASSNEYYVFLRSASETGFVHKVKVGTDYADIIVGTTQILINTWYHIAVVRNGNNYTLYVNGTSEGTSTGRTDVLGQNTGMKIGSLADGTLPWNGYIDEVRVSNTARYTGNFTPATAQFEADANTLLLVHGDGTTLGTQIYNDIYAPPAVGHQSKTVMPYGNAQISTAQSKFGGSSVLFDGTGDYLAVPYHASFAYGTGDFTIELWIRFNALSTVDNKIVWDQRPSETSGGAYPTIYVTTAQKFVYFANGANRCIGTTTAVINTWYHIAVSRTAGSTRLFVNGTQEGDTYSDATNYLTNTTELRIAQNFFAGSPDNINGYYDEIRVSNNSRYSTTFTPSTTPFQSDANTLLLLHCDGANGSTKFVDDGSNPTVLDDAVIHASVTGTASTITIPAAAAVGDYAVLFDTSTTTTNTIPSGWTSINGATTSGIRTNVSYKRLLSGDPGSSITGMAGTTRKILLIVKGNSDITSVSVSTPGSQATVATPTNQTISSTGQVTPTVFFAVYAATGSIATRGWSGGTPTEYSSVSSSGIYVKALTYGKSTTPASATMSMSDGGTNTLQSFSMKFA